MTEIFLNDKCYKLPENWTEVNPAQLPELLTLLYVYPESGGTYLEILRTILGYPPGLWKKLMCHYFAGHRTEEQHEENAQALQGVLGQISWMWQGELTVCPLPEGFDVDGTRWVLFEEGFRSMSFGELTNAHINAQAFIKQLVEGDERLNMLVATVCRPRRSGNYMDDPDWNGDHREQYNEHIARHRADLIKDGYIKEKILVLMYFLGTLKEFFSFYDLFDSDATGPAPTEDYPGQSMVKNQHLLSEKHIFGGMNATKSANIHDVFQFLEEHKKDIKEQNQRNQAANDAN
ncbi:hypothetical protein GCM10010967_12050 [Dyadobacter beijingensis]|uniref:Uncharacterized protein n=1 Tax=Dyadobacter beijingensis TaxID=365489 RepID=A0ABQ2HHG9_9BACT|nr:hypothetical protein [Dyadobacter beijingensis]GGM81861.1 hypothetical protein GCM10010967_12050 [Dyadobacter beijingensis]